MTGEAVRNNEEMFRALVEHSTHAIILVAIDGTVTYANPFMEQMIGYKQHEFEGKNALHIIHPGDIPGLKASLDDLFRRPGDFIPFTLRMRHQKGTWCWMEGTLRNCLNMPNLQALVGIFQDITEKKQAEEKTQQQKELYRIVVEQASEAIFITDQQGRYIEINAAACSISGYSRDELLNKEILDLTPEENRKRFEPIIQQVLTGKIRHLRGTIRRKDGILIPIDLLANRLSNGNMLGIVRDMSITQQREKERARLLAREKAAHAEAEAARMWLYQLFMQAPADIAIMEGPEHRFVLTNPRFLQTVGRGEEIGQPAFSHSPEPLAKNYKAILDEVYTTGIPFTGNEKSIFIDRHGDGKYEEGFFNFVYQPFRNVQGEIEGIMLHGIEVTEQVQARHHVEKLVAELQAEREALRNAEQEAAQHASRFAAIFEAMRDGVIVVDKHGYIVEMNAITRKFIGQSLEKIALSSLGSILPKRLLPHNVDGELLELAKWPTVRVLKGEYLSGNTTDDLLFYNKEGAPLLFNVSGAPVFDSKGEIIGGVVVLREVTKRRELEQQLQYSERKLHSLVNANIFGVAVIETGGRVLEVNDLFVNMLGYSEAEMLAPGFKWKNFISSDKRSTVVPMLQLMNTTGTIPPWETSYRRKDGKQFPVLITATVIDPEHKLALVLMLDISDRKAAELRKQEFLSMISHELRTPLTGIVGFLDLALFSIRQLAQTPDPEHDELILQIEWMLEQIEQHASIETRLVDALLDGARMEQHTFQLSLKAANLAEIVQDVVNDVMLTQHQAAAQRIVLVRPQQKEVPTMIDADRIKQVLTNYLTNALKYAPGDEEITVSLGVEESFARVYVQDRGPGLTTAQRQHVWERFYQGDPTINRNFENGGLGLGLGLYISRVLIEQHHGEVGVDSQVGEGSTFWFTLPLLSSRAE